MESNVNLTDTDLCDSSKVRAFEKSFRERESVRATVGAVVVSEAISLNNKTLLMREVLNNEVAVV